MGKLTERSHRHRDPCRRREEGMTLAEIIERERPALIAAAWQAWHKRHSGRIGPGPAFSEAIDAILATLRALHQDRPDAG